MLLKIHLAIIKEYLFLLVKNDILNIYIRKNEIIIT